MSNQSDLAKSAAGFNGDPLNIDTANNRVGVGTVSPSATLDVNGTIKLDGNYPVGTGNVALGDAALDDGSLTGNYNVAVGLNTLTALTSGGNNTALGGNAGAAATTADMSVFVGRAAGVAVTTGDYNTAIGAEALKSNTTASNNTAVGYQALYSTTGGSNTAIGYQAGQNITTGVNNTAIGRRALHNTTTGSANYGIGDAAGRDITTGNYNVVVGGYGGNQNGLNISTSSNNIVLSDGQGNPRGRFDGNGKFHTISANDQGIEIRIGSTTSTNGKALDFVDGDSTQCGKVVINASANTVSYQTSSDGSKKTNYRAIDNPTDRVKALNPLKFDWISDGSTSEGFIAQEIKRDTQLGLDCVDGEEGSMTMDYSRVTPLLTAALKEAITKIEQLETENTAIKARLDALELP